MSQALRAAARIAALGSFVVALLCTRAFAGPDGDFAVANRAYSEGDFAAALRAYERSLAAELHANALCNLGNTCFRLGKLGPAALSYERALTLQPRLPDAVANLRLTREKSGARLLDQPWWEKALTWFSASTATVIAIGTAWFFALAAATMAWRKKYGVAFWGAVLGVLFAAGYGAAIFWVTGDRGSIAIVITERAAVHPEPAEHSKSAESLPGGSQVRVLGESGDWKYCRLPGGGRGWVPAAAVEFLLPRSKTLPRIGAAGAALPSLATVTLTPAAARTADWRDEIWKKPGTFTKLRAGVFRYTFGWGEITAAEAEASSTLSPEGRCMLDFSARTTGIARTMWTMDATAVSSCDPATFHPLKLTQTETYKKKVVTTVVDFLADGPVQRRSQQQPDAAGATEVATRSFRFPHVHDLNSAVLFIRSQALAQGDSVKLCVYPSGAPYLATATVTGRERLTVAGREWDTIKCDLNLSGIADDFTLKPHKKFKKATAWISDDSDRMLLKISAEVQVGSVWAELQSADFAGGK